jgi:AcrR family transcriptional regulator
VGVNHRAAYRHFASKEDLLAAIAEQGYARLADAFEASVAEVAEDDPIGRLTSLGQGYVRFALAEPATYGVMFGRRLNEDGRFPAIEVPIARAVACLSRELQNGQARGVFRPDPVRELGFSVWSSMHGIASLVISRRIRVKSVHRDAYVATLIAPTLRGLEPD